jgi:hypothetical protein
MAAVPPIGEIDVATMYTESRVAVNTFVCKLSDLSLDQRGRTRRITGVHPLNAQQNLTIQNFVFRAANLAATLTEAFRSDKIHARATPLAGEEKTRS